jgi:hypothetical protein
LVKVCRGNQRPLSERVAEIEQWLQDRLDTFVSLRKERAQGLAKYQAAADRETDRLSEIDSGLDVARAAEALLLKRLTIQVAEIDDLARDRGQQEVAESAAKERLQSEQKYWKRRLRDAGAGPVRRQRRLLERFRNRIEAQRVRKASGLAERVVVDEAAEVAE